MNNIEAVPYRTPACDKHLPNNEDTVCPWCRLADIKQALTAGTGTLWPSEVNEFCKILLKDYETR